MLWSNSSIYHAERGKNRCPCSMKYSRKRRTNSWSQMKAKTWIRGCQGASVLLSGMCPPGGPSKRIRKHLGSRDWAQPVQGSRLRTGFFFHRGHQHPSVLTVFLGDCLNCTTWCFCLHFVVRVETKTPWNPQAQSWYDNPVAFSICLQHVNVLHFPRKQTLTGNYHHLHRV